MIVPLFRIRLNELHKKSGLTAYAVAKETGLIQNTVRKYLTEEIVTERVHSYIVTLAEFYGADWRDVVEVIEDDDLPEIETPLLLAV